VQLVIAIDERSEGLLARLPRILNLQGAEILFAHVLDPGGPEEWERVAGRHLLRPKPPARAGEQMRATDRAEGGRLLSRAAAATEGWKASAVRTRLLEGSPKHEIVALLAGENADLLVVFVHGQEVGPKSIHKEARFLIDHAPCAVLVMKG
jgi:nucleotide-binding universal stress UspA family protein